MKFRNSHCNYFGGLVLLIISFVMIMGGCSKSDSSGDSEPLAAEAAAAGYDVPDAALQGVADFVLLGGITTITDISGALSGSTALGVLSLDMTVGTASGAISVYIWRNDDLILLRSSASSSESISSDLVVVDGNNYICIVIYVDGVIYGRSKVVKVTSTAPPSIARFELTWDNLGDIDLHIDNVGLVIHVYYGSDLYNTGGYNLNLDVDNTTSFGPENIRIYTVNATTSFRVFVNYYSSDVSSDVVATVRAYDSANHLIGTALTHTFHLADANASSSFNAASWTVGSYSVSTP